MQSKAVETAYCDDPFVLDASAVLIGQAIELEKINLLQQCKTAPCVHEHIVRAIGLELIGRAGIEPRLDSENFRYVPTKPVSVRCRKSYLSDGKPKLFELLFSFKANGPTFAEVNLYPDDRFSMSTWGWLRWNGWSSGSVLGQYKSKQVVARRNHPVGHEFVSALSSGRMHEWLLYEEESDGAAVVSFEFDGALVGKCLDEVGR